MVGISNISNGYKSLAVPKRIDNNAVITKFNRQSDLLQQTNLKKQETSSVLGIVGFCTAIIAIGAFALRGKIAKIKDNPEIKKLIQKLKENALNINTFFQEMSKSKHHMNISIHTGTQFKRKT